MMTIRPARTTGQVKVPPYAAALLVFTEYPGGGGSLTLPTFPSTP